MLPSRPERHDESVQAFPVDLEEEACEVLTLGQPEQHARARPITARMASMFTATIATRFPAQLLLRRQL